MNAPTRTFQAKPATRGAEPLLIGMVGPPGGGKTYSALRLARGMRESSGGRAIVVIDTEGGRSRKYAGEFQFLHAAFDPPHRPEDFLAAIQQMLPHNPACIIVDSMSDEHEGVGGYLDWHDEQVPRVGGNSWAAWAQPSASRKKLIRGMLQIKVPLIFTFRAREKTQQQLNARNKAEIVNIGWMPVAPLEIVHTLDLTCILPPRAEGVPVWESSKIGEDFIIKLPGFLKHCIGKGQLDENTGKALAQWAAGTTSVPPTEMPAPSHSANPHAPPADGNGAGDPLAIHDAVLSKAAEGGMDALSIAWDDVPPALKRDLKAALDRRYKPRAIEVDARDRS